MRIMRRRTMRFMAPVVVSALIISALPAAASATPRSKAGPPAEGSGQVKRVDEDGSVPAKWDLPKPPALGHPDVAPASAGGNGDGRNNLSFSAFDSGDMVVALGTLTGHAGCFNKASFANLDSLCVWSANKQPRNGVQLERPRLYHTYDHAYGIWVPSHASYGSSVVSYCAAQNGEPYNISSSKTNTGEWYCSKLPWKAWQVRTGLDLDADGGFWVWPVDLVNSRYTRIFASSS